MSSFAICKKCGALITYEEEETYWDESGYMYSTKLVNCNKCKTPNVLKYEEDSWVSDYGSKCRNYNYFRKHP